MQWSSDKRMNNKQMKNTNTNTHFCVPYIIEAIIHKNKKYVRVHSFNNCNS